MGKQRGRTQVCTESQGRLNRGGSLSSTEMYKMNRVLPGRAPRRRNNPERTACAKGQILGLAYRGSSPDRHEQSGRRGKQESSKGCDTTYEEVLPKNTAPELDQKFSSHYQFTEAESPGELLKSAESDSVDLEWNPRFCISSRLPPGDTDAAGPWAIFQQQSQGTEEMMTCMCNQ